MLPQAMRVRRVRGGGGAGRGWDRVRGWTVVTCADGAGSAERVDLKH